MKFLRSTSCLLLVGLALLTNGCADLNEAVGPVHRLPLTVTPMTNSFPPNLQPIVVSVQGPLPGQPLSETIWTSESGPFLDVYESKQIGWTQINNELVGIASWESKIYMPFGRIFEGVFKSGLTNAFPNAVVSNGCQTNAFASNSVAKAKYAVRVTVRDFSVFEKPVQHLNLLATVDCAVFESGNTNAPVFTYSAYAESLKQPLGYVHWTATPVIKSMSKMSNDLAATLSEDILRQLLKNIGR